MSQALVVETPTLRRVSQHGALAVASFGALLAFLDVTVVNIAFPSIEQSFPTTSIGALSWVLNAYNIVFAALLVAAGRLADVFGRRRTFAAGLLLFTASSALCAAAPGVGALVAARVAQAVGAGLIVPASLAIVIEAFPADRRAHALGLWGATAALAAGLGPPVGGALVQLERRSRSPAAATSRRPPDANSAMCCSRRCRANLRSSVQTSCAPSSSRTGVVRSSRRCARQLRCRGCTRRCASTTPTASPAACWTVSRRLHSPHQTRGRSWPSTPPRWAGPPVVTPVATDAVPGWGRRCCVPS